MILLSIVKLVKLIVLLGCVFGYNYYLKLNSLDFYLDGMLVIR